MAVERAPAAVPVTPIVTAAIAFGVTTQMWTPALWVSGAALAAWIVRWRWQVQRGTEFLVTSSSVIIGSAVASISVPAGDPYNPVLSGVPARFALSMLVLAVVRLYLASPLGGHAASVALALLALMACGLTKAGPTYAGLTAAFLASATIALRRGDPVRARWSKWDWKRRAASVFAALAATGFGFGIASATPTVHARIVRALLQIDRGRAISSFAEQIQLGRSADITPSERLVLRVRGAHVDYLRGTAYRFYDGGEWAAGEEDGRTVSTMAPSEGAPVEVRAARPAARYFLPKEARAIGTPGGRSVATKSGGLLSPSGTSADIVWFQIGERDSAPIAAPEDGDLQVPVGLRDQFASIAREFAGDSATTQARLEAIEQELRTSFSYSLRHVRPDGGDPILDFLKSNRSGHCEYFASAMVLLARSLEIPARVVGGYRVTEYNPLGDYWVVREKNAHAWVEAWVPGKGWTSFDPTPGESAAAMSEARSPIMAAMLDLVFSGWLVGWTPEATREHLAIAAGFMITFALLRQMLRWLGRRTGKRGSAERSSLQGSFGLLCRTLAAHGELRNGSETIEQFARRVRKSRRMPSELGADAAAILEQYARLRYGGQGRQADIDRDVRDWVRRMNADRAGWRWERVTEPGRS